MSKRGFMTIGIDTDTDQIKYSYALALSIKNCDSNAEVCLVVDKDKTDLINKNYLHAFDYIVELPFGNTGHTDGFHGSNFWQLLHCTPFDETIYVDADTLFLNININLLWQHFYRVDIGVPSVSRNFRNAIAPKNQVFEIESHYELPKLYNQLFYFNSSPNAIEWFKMADPIFQNWRDAYNAFFKEIKPQTFDKNLLCNIVTHSLDKQLEIGVVLNDFYDLAIQGQNLWHNELSTQWTNVLNSWYTDKKEIIIENSTISNAIVHYRDENFLTQEIIDDLRTSFNTEKIRSQLN